MRTSLIETKQIDDYLFHSADAHLFEAKLILQPALREKLKWQQCAYKLIHAYGRQQLKAEIEAVHQKLFSEPVHRGFSQRIRTLFSSH
jgi:hypothetical protein